MADIELVIKLPEQTVNDIKDNAMFAGSISSEILWDITGAIVNGTPLPKGHGDLIDREELLKQPMDKANYPSNYVKLAPIIVEADKAEEEHENNESVAEMMNKKKILLYESILHFLIEAEKQSGNYDGGGVEIIDWCRMMIGRSERFRDKE